MEKIQKDMIALLKSRIENTECVLSKNPDWQAILNMLNILFQINLTKNICNISLCVQMLMLIKTITYSD